MKQYLVKSNLGPGHSEKMWTWQVWFYFSWSALMPKTNIFKTDDPKLPTYLPPHLWKTTCYTEVSLYWATTIKQV